MNETALAPPWGLKVQLNGMYVCIAKALYKMGDKVVGQIYKNKYFEKKLLIQTNTVYKLNMKGIMNYSFMVFKGVSDHQHHVWDLV